jgi:hypothetical protein
MLVKAPAGVAEGGTAEGRVCAASGAPIGASEATAARHATMLMRRARVTHAGVERSLVMPLVPPNEERATEDRRPVKLLCEEPDRWGDVARCAGPRPGR